jgi:hypothetical protein
MLAELCMMTIFFAGRRLLLASIMRLPRDGRRPIRWPSRGWLFHQQLNLGYFNRHARPSPASMQAKHSAQPSILRDYLD